MNAIVSKEIRLASRPVGMPTADNFELAEVTMPDLADRQVLIRNDWLTVDPYMRGRMYDMKSYVPPFQIGEPLQGGAVGEVVESRNDAFPVGTFVNHMDGWREYAINDATMLQKIDPSLAPLQTFLGALGMPGLTAYGGLLTIGQPKEGETVFVSAASGAVGQLVCQIAKIKGCRVVGSAGGKEKCDWLTEVAGIDAAVDYKACATQGELQAAVAEACPKGIDIYFENVGGDHLTTALNLANPWARIPMCGTISTYNAMEKPEGISNLSMVIGKRIRMEGFISFDYIGMADDFTRDMAGWIKSGEVKLKEDVVEGVENTPQAFMNLFTGGNFGKMLVKV